MKLNKSFKYVGSLPSKLKIASIGLALSLSCASTSQAAITWTFAEIGGNVVGTVTGSLSVVVVAGYQENNTITSFNGSNRQYAINTGYAEGKVGTQLNTGTRISVNPTSSTGNFGIFNTGLFWDRSLGGTLAANTPIESATGGAPTQTWNSTTIDALFGAGAIDTPVTIWAVNGGGAADIVQFVAVPEPSTTALLGLGGLALILRRRKG